MATSRGSRSRPARTTRPGEVGAVPPVPTGPPATLFVDAAARPARSRADLADAFFSLLLAALVLVAAVLAPGTTRALAVDVRAATGGLWQAVLVAPLAAFEGAATFLVPLAVLAQQWLRSGWHAAVRALLTLVAGTLLGVGVALGFMAAQPGTLTLGAPGDEIELRVVLNPFVAGLAAMLTIAGARSRSRLLRACWWVLGAVVLLLVLRGQMTLPAAAVMWLLGRACGQIARFVTGTPSGAATGIELVAAMRTAGVDATTLVRTDEVDAPAAWHVSAPTPLGYTETVHERPRPAEMTEAEMNDADGARGPGAERIAGDADPDAMRTRLRPRATATPAPDADAAALADAARRLVAPTRPGESTHRHYLAREASGNAADVLVLDAAQHEVTLLQEAWRRVVRPGLERHPSRSLDAAAERAALVTLGARNAGVRTAGLRGLAMTAGSALVVTEHVPGLRRLDALAPEELTDALLDDVWTQVRRAHRAGIAHLALSAASVVVDPTGAVWIRGWHDGEVASTEVARRIDLAQVLTLEANLVGTERALASATRSLSPQALMATAPLLQGPALPPATRAALVRPAALLGELREALVSELPEADLEPVQLRRFSWRSVVAAVVLVAILWALLTSLDVEAVLDAARSANPWWIVAAFAAGLLTYVGGGLTLAAFSPGRRVTVATASAVQLAARVVGIAAPAGIGPAAVNLRYLLRQGVTTTVSVATVALVQLNQFVVTVLVLALVAAFTGSFGAFGAPGPGSVWALLVVALLAAAVLAIGPLRRWLWRRTGPTLTRAWGRLTWLASHPGRLALGVLGAFVMTAGYVAAFGFALAAFGYALPLTQLALAYLVSSTLGSMVPTPGGIGPVEAALTGGLTLAGIPASVAVSTAVIFRLVTFWLPVPLGWLALRRLQRVGVL